MSSFTALKTSQKIQWAVSILLPLSMFLLPIPTSLKLFFAITLWGIFTVAFNTMHQLVPSLLMPALYVLTGLADASVVYGPWASTTISLAISSLIMANCLAECGLLKRVAYWMLQKCGGKFTRVCWSIFFVATVLSIVTFGNIAFVIAALVASLIRVLGIEKTNEGHALMLGTMYACFTTLWYVYNPTSVPIVAAASAPALGEIINVTWLDFAYANWPIIIFSILLEWIFLKMYRVSKSTINLDPNYFKEQLAKMGKMTKREKWGVVLLAIIVIYILTSPIHKLDTSFGFILFAIFALFPGIEVAKPESLKNVDWSIAFFIAAFLAIGAVATVLNINSYFVEFAGSVVNQLGTGSTMGFIMLLGTLANLLLTPIAILTTLGAPMAQLAVTFGFDPMASFFTLIFTEWLIVLPYESFPTLIWFAFGVMTMKDFFKASIVRILTFFAFFFLAIMPWWHFIGML